MEYGWSDSMIGLVAILALGALSWSWAQDQGSADVQIDLLEGSIRTLHLNPSEEARILDAVTAAAKKAQEFAPMQWYDLAVARETEGAIVFVFTVKPAPIRPEGRTKAAAVFARHGRPDPYADEVAPSWGSPWHFLITVAKETGSAEIINYKTRPIHAAKDEGESIPPPLTREKVERGIKEYFAKRFPIDYYEMGPLDEPSEEPLSREHAGDEFVEWGAHAHTVWSVAFNLKRWTSMDAAEIERAGWSFAEKGIYWSPYETRRMDGVNTIIITVDPETGLIE